ncbi:hypothetical protein DFA_07687 [Cavenderia fasciculata]|uniref:LRAT domain-containing protein n=1 Tax=Cavenderia fasciculata TaxID=261658 RepID=F4Q2T3_CACFS|nr:uncharacterized protein DFA_07687 [Cavenderia fasciculata]EGG16709.1 hypothetical protein DFA_07687 [Cavenderia fasciculata]|eukprot:XP_004355183.1 hypothetical protein DFA_07687 [Cavenderia fasciculata]
MDIFYQNNYSTELQREDSYQVAGRHLRLPRHGASSSSSSSGVPTYSESKVGIERTLFMCLSISALSFYYLHYLIASLIATLLAHNLLYKVAHFQVQMKSLFKKTIPLPSFQHIYTKPLIMLGQDLTHGEIVTYFETFESGEHYYLYNKENNTFIDFVRVKYDLSQGLLNNFGTIRITNANIILKSRSKLYRGDIRSGNNQEIESTISHAITDYVECKRRGGKIGYHLLLFNCHTMVKRWRKGVKKDFRNVETPDTPGVIAFGVNYLFDQTKKRIFGRTVAASHLSSEETPFE